MQKEELHELKVGLEEVRCPPLFLLKQILGFSSCDEKQVRTLILSILMYGADDYTDLFHASNEQCVGTVKFGLQLLQLPRGADSVR